jgi:hypothetical protein
MNTYSNSLKSASYQIDLGEHNTRLMSYTHDI